jgi:hypothetical protein
MNNGNMPVATVAHKPASEFNIYAVGSELKHKRAKQEAREKAERAVFVADELPRLLDEFKRIFRATNPVLIPGKGRTKFEPTVKWTEIEDFSGDYLAKKLAECIRDDGNIAILLGSKSGDLVTIDIDADELVEPFLKANPRFRETFRTFGSKGAQFWFKATGEYPKKCKMLRIAGRISKTGEFRSGVLSTVYGTHPNGNRYRWINESPIITVDCKDIDWPDGWGLEDPLPSKFNKKRFWSLISSEDDFGIKELLIDQYFPGAKDTETEWRCGDISGREPTGQGSLVIFKSNGWCFERDGGEWSKGLLETICSSERAALTGEAITEDDVFRFIKEEIGEDFLIKPRKAAETIIVASAGTIEREKFIYLIDDGDCFYFNHGPKWGRISDHRLRLILGQDYSVEDEEMDAAVRDLMITRQVVAVADVAGYDAGVHEDSKGRKF